MGFRLVCGTLIVLCSCFIAFEKRSRLYIRVQSLEMIRDYFRNVRLYISHVGMSLDDIAFEIDRGVNRTKFSRIIREKTQHDNFSTSFSDTVHSLKGILCITSDDDAMLCSFAKRIGLLDREGALELLQLADEQLSSVIGSAVNKCKTDGKIYIALGLSCGIVAALMLL